MLDKRNWRTALGDADHATRTDQIEEPDAALAATTDDKLLGLRAGFDRLAVPVLEGLGDDPSTWISDCWRKSSRRRISCSAAALLGKDALPVKSATMWFPSCVVSMLVMPPPSMLGYDG